jgi:hypothetical protein
MYQTLWGASTLPKQSHERYRETVDESDSDHRYDAIETHSWDELIRDLDHDEWYDEWKESQSDEPDRNSDDTEDRPEDQIDDTEYDSKYQYRSIAMGDRDIWYVSTTRPKVDAACRKEKLDEIWHRTDENNASR